MIQHMHCLLVFCEMSFPIRLNFSPLTGIIFWSLFDEITIHRNVKTTFHYVLFMCFIIFFTVFFMLTTWYCIICFLSFFLVITISRIHCNFMFITFLNRLWHFLIFKDVSSLFSNILHMLQHKMFLEFLNAIPHSMHVTTMMFCKIPSQEQPFLAFFTWILLSFCGCVPKQFWFKLQSKNIDGNFVPIIFNSPAIRAKDLFLVQTWLCIGVS